MDEHSRTESDLRLSGGESVRVEQGNARSDRRTFSFEEQVLPVLDRSSRGNRAPC